ncbi:uncharacterized protein CTRU02_202946 [Colletotrichum truncatum]|uniref:Uncharacterized protein n=1 Tax=Colletotrichum truncatum TaxID=5467 RepID=A0ACC3Z7Y2_COLTU|nr:uncharacterized protein CTRU02_13233 [Colletotrichum truncatum]KAF6783725.1 hypothetical protein CTRU02_13233 [Colletotrichum truncatum]
MVDHQETAGPVGAENFGPDELAFRDETHTTAQKILVRQTSTPLGTVPYFTWDALSRNAFLSLYVDRYSYGFENLGCLLAKSPANGHLHASVDAVGLAFISLQDGRPDLVSMANQRYLSAIKNLRTTIQHLHQPATDSISNSVSNNIIQSVLLLDLYEKLTAHRGETVSVSNSWLSHIYGALSMIRTRPTVDFSNAVTRQLANRTVIALTISCGAAGIKIPDALKALQKDLDGYIRSAKWAFIGMLSKIVDFRADIRNDSLTSSRILSQARELDAQLGVEECNMPRSWQPQRVYVSNRFVLDNYYDHYTNHYTTQVSNAFRIMRLEMNGIIQNIEHTSSVTQNIIGITRDICATVPQFILPEARPENNLPLTPLQILECCGLLTPLYVAAQITTESFVREWILECLDHMAENGVKMAKEVAQVLRVTPKADYWSVFAMVGSCAITA